MSPLAKSYQYLIDEFSEEKLESRFQFIQYECLDILKRFNSETLDTSIYFDVSGSIVQDIVINYFADIDRLKKFHGINKVNSIKIASYSSYWVSKLKPIQLIKKPNREIRNQHRRLFSKINEKVALGIMFGIAFDQKVFHETDQETTILYKAIIYSLAYRTITPQSLDLMIQAHISHTTSPQRNMID